MQGTQMTPTDSPLAASDWRLFLARWLRQPLTVGAVAPSSRFLARAMLRAAEPVQGPVLELGAGTGVFTRGLIASGLSLDQLIVVERIPAFAAALRARFPGLRLIEGDAAALTPSALDAPVARIVSGLPLRAMDALVIERILQAAFDCAQPQARFVQFSYGLRCPVPTPIRERLGLHAQRVAWVARNLPPASVWSLRRV
jgi:phospholipid N-methyltransferase